MVRPAQKRPKPYAWVTWLAKLMAGEKLCKYAVWLLTQYQFDKLPSSFDASEHDDMVIQRASKLQAEGFTVYVEEANSLKVNGQTFNICIAGKPDIVAIKDGWVVVEDCKTGKRRDSHRFQVLLYMLLLPLAPETKHRCQGQTPHGRLVYRDGVVEIPASAVDSQFKQLLRQTIATIISTTPPSQTSSTWECHYCNIPGTYCSARIDSGSDTAA
jgi:CRISPR/Cas system-associated exonuclease Cas4 (RecB family)